MQYFDDDRELIQQVLGKMLGFSESLDDIEEWMEGKLPERLAAGVRVADFSIGKQSPVTLERLDQLREPGA